jgi:hypothetical protein
MGVYANTNGYYLSVTGSIGYQFNSKYALTVGAGLFRGNENMLPVFLMNRISFMDGMVTPTLGIEAGYIFIKEKNYNYYSIGRSKDHYDSVYLNPSVGVKIRMSRNSSWGFDFGYRYWAILNEYNIGNENNIGLITFQTGVEF